MDASKMQAEYSEHALTEPASYAPYKQFPPRVTAGVSPITGRPYVRVRL